MYLCSELSVLTVSSDDQELICAEKLWKHLYRIYGIRFVQRYVVYRYFRNLGWVVRSGLPYGTSFVIYRDGPDFYHSSAAVRIVNGVKQRETLGFAALNRELNNMKKALVEVQAEIPESLELHDLSSIRRIKIQHITPFTWKTSEDS